MIARSRNAPDEEQKRVFVRNIEAKLIEKRHQLSFIKRKIKKASESHRIGLSEQLLRAELSADSSIEELQVKLDLLEIADDESWPDRRFDVETAWDEVSQAIKKVVARFP